MIIKHDGCRYHKPCFYSTYLACMYYTGVISTVKGMYDKWNNIPHNTKTEINGRGPCEPSLTSLYAYDIERSGSENLSQ